MKYKLIVVAGTMGVGKTTLARHLSSKLALHLLEENFGENPFLKPFYKNPQWWAFHSQLFFLMQKAKILLEARDMLRTVNVVVDASITQYAEGYAAANFMKGNISKKDYALYKGIYMTYKRLLPREDLTVFLSASLDTIIKRIKDRSRDFEQALDLDYLGMLYELDKKWFKECNNGLKIDTEGLNLVDSEKDIRSVVKIVQKNLH